MPDNTTENQEYDLALILARLEKGVTRAAFDRAVADHARQDKKEVLEAAIAYLKRSS